MFIICIINLYYCISQEAREIWLRNLYLSHECKISGTLSSDRLIDGRNKC